MGNLATNGKTSGTRLDKANTKLNEQQIREMYEEFNYEAESGTGRMNKRQFRKFYKHVTGSEDENGSLADKAFAVFDTNHSDSIDFSEFVLASTVGYKNDLDSQLELAFSM
ncbi:unnamed protein product [Rotaria sp. Silwood2]|nr:unnamed protein product [Rotaria sp. Silwood2]CAF4205731.1 unnamed protein product [Rotaria sp. Silwood2]